LDWSLIVCFHSLKLFSLNGIDDKPSPLNAILIVDCL
jgi:hypothetical protein